MACTVDDNAATAAALLACLASDDFDTSDINDDDLITAAAHAEAVPGSHKRAPDAEDRMGPISKKLKVESESRSIAVALKVLNELFGLPSFRLQQQDVVSRILDGNSAVVIFPTGGGKSLCYQVTKGIPSSVTSEN